MLSLLVGPDGAEIARHLQPTPPTGSAVVTAASAAVAFLSEQAGDMTVAGTGIGIAGLVGIDGRIRRAPNLIEADGLDVRSELEPRIKMAVVVDNDANCAARAEHDRGSAQGVDNVLLVTLGTGIGGAVIVDGRVARGGAGFAGEPGHILVDPDGPVCPCGLHGCWERYASGAGLRHLAQQAIAAGRWATAPVQASEIVGEHVTAAAQNGDVDAVAVIAEFALWVARGLSICVAILDPALIVIGGGLVRAWDLFGADVQTQLRGLIVGGDQRPPIPVVAAQAAESAGALGAALLSQQEFAG